MEGTFEKAAIPGQARISVTDQVLRRIRNEYLEMPGLRLTVCQAQRLWGLDAETCSQAIQLLIEAKFLCRTGIEYYGRRTEGMVKFQSRRMVST
jgi:hypothetical protein